ncbi:GTPase-activating protein [Orbilia blumenaviensis]|uniref:GTPase-activating protein n=1 Tax=Orbilia blumenaviensis TaxID=1796055 RepID=A0AAV9TY92_9PEZI
MATTKHHTPGLESPPTTGTTIATTTSHAASSSAAAEEKHIEIAPTSPTSPRSERYSQWPEQNNPEDDEDLDRIIRQISRVQSRAGRPHEPGHGLKRVDTVGTVSGVTYDDPRLNPENPTFDRNLFIKRFIRSLEQEGLKHSRCGFMFKDLNVSGVGAEIQYQETVLSAVLASFRGGKTAGREKVILRNFDGLVEEGEMLIVLGRPGSGCSTFLKTICGEDHGLKISDQTVVKYNGLDRKTFLKEFRGEAVYNQEQDQHFPHLTVQQTLEFAAAARTPSARVEGFGRDEYAKMMTGIIMSVLGLSHTKNTKVGNDFVRGVSGGERKRVSLAEMALAGAPIAAWDNSSRGLDSATALEFVRSLKGAASYFGVTQAVAIYQASQSIYDLFDKVVVLYKGRQIFFGRTERAKAYFEEMGWECPVRQTTGDFLTSVTNPSERKARPGYENKVPRTPEEFETYWMASADRRRLIRDMDDWEAVHSGEQTYGDLREARKLAQADHVRPESPYTLSIAMQIGLCTKRAYQRMWMDLASTVTQVIGNVVMALIIGSIFYGAPLSTASFFSKTGLLFFAILLNALGSITEINLLYDQRPIVHKHNSYAFYHPWTEAAAGIVSDIPVKFCAAVAFNLVIYFLGGLSYEASKFFIFFLFSFITTLAMSAIFRTMAAATKTISQAMALAGILVLAIVIYTGYTITPPYQHKWFFWISYINPIRYAYEALLVNEVHGLVYECANLIPPYGTGDNFACAVAGATPGSRVVSGEAWASTSFEYSYSHLWRNFGIVVAFLIFFWVTYFAATEWNSKSGGSAEFLVYRRGHAPALKGDDEEGSGGSVQGEVSGGKDDKVVLAEQTDVFTWRDVTLDIMVANEKRRLLDGVSGWVKPGTLTALMGVSGAGKTTLLDCLAQRMKIGVLTGDMLVNGKPLAASFQRSTGYVQQQDLHLETATVRESLRFSAVLRQPEGVSVEEKHAHVEDVIKMLGMEDFAEAVVGNPGEGLNVEQRKLLTIGVELAAKPDLLLFLDEPTSGLDSQSSWSIVNFLRKLADSGQAVLSTIHQPSAILFQEFDRLLFLARGGKTVYFGDIGQNSHTLLEYFEGNGARKCSGDENPAEYMLEIINGGGKDWPAVWKGSQQAKDVQTELDRIHESMMGQAPKESGGSREFAMPLGQQVWYVTVRVFQQYWRTPSYIYGKLLLGVASALFIGFSFYIPKSSQAGTQSLIFAVFMIMSIFSTIVQQIMPRFVIQRSLYEVRERPSKAYSWIAFIIAQIVVEIPYQILLGVLVWASWYWPVFGRHNPAEVVILVLLYLVQFFIFASTFAQMLVAGLPDAATAGTLATLMFSLTLTFNGVIAPPDTLPGFWIFMYRVSPLTYLVGGMAGASMHNRKITCATEELAIFPPPSGETCASYLAPYFSAGAPGYLQQDDQNSTTECRYCSIQVSDQFLGASGIEYAHRWRNFGIVWAFVGFNILATVVFYYLLRVKVWKSPEAKKRSVKVALRRLRDGRRVGRRFLTDKDECPLEKKKTNDRVF